jgi:hypothetical protein
MTLGISGPWESASIEGDVVIALTTDPSRTTVLGTLLNNATNGIAASSGGATDPSTAAAAVACTPVLARIVTWHGPHGSLAHRLQAIPRLGERDFLLDLRRRQHQVEELGHPRLLSAVSLLQIE